MNVLFAGGGTGGHLYPALAIARALVAANPEVKPFFIGAQRGVERTVLPTTEFPHELLDLHPLYRQRPWQNWRTLRSSTGAWRRISALVDELRPGALVATGGYAAGIALAVAARRRVPIVIQEQNSFPGLTVRTFARRAAQIHLGFPEARARLRLGPRTQLFATGNPIEPPPPPGERRLRVDASTAWGFADPARPVVLVFGGSQGSAAINAVVAEWLKEREVTRGGVNVIWATGPSTYDRYAALDAPDVRVRPYIAPMRDAYSASTLAVTRAGAMTTAELSAWGLPSVLVPLPTAAADHQTANARAIAADGAAVMIEQRELTPSTLGNTIHSLLTDERRLDGMRSATLRRARPDAAQNIAGHILELLCLK